jgi:hypothetical protein
MLSHRLIVVGVDNGTDIQQSITNSVVLFAIFSAILALLKLLALRLTFVVTAHLFFNFQKNVIGS